ncbi:hypothetical protein HY408_02270 [Candidatus Gottesmanbacteria bacterium]|nr:hypothetical protein [Candidatus Gottesmanbacteria bacterium]
MKRLAFALGGLGILVVLFFVRLPYFERDPNIQCIKAPCGRWIWSSSLYERLQVKLDQYEVQQAVPKVFAPPIAAVPSSWNTYANESLGISFKYPPDWEVIESEAGVTVGRGFDPRMITGSCPKYSFSIFKYGEKDQSESKELNKTVVSREIAYEEENTQGNCYFKSIYIKYPPVGNKSPPYTINMTRKDKDPIIFEQMLSTLIIESIVPQFGDAGSKDACDLLGGTWQAWGLLRREYCQLKAPDGGKACRDGSECSLGRCISEGGSIPGKCQTYKLTFGCYSFVENGTTGRAICVD